MSGALSPETIAEIVERSVEECLEQALAVADALLGPDGETYGMVPLRGAEIIAEWLWLGDHEVQLPDEPVIDEKGKEIGVQPGRLLEHVNRLPHLAAVAPKHFAQKERDYERERAKQAERAP